MKKTKKPMKTKPVKTKPLKTKITKVAKQPVKAAKTIPTKVEEKPRQTKTIKLMEEVVSELVGDEALPIVHYLKGKKNISEFKIAEDVNEEIHRTRNILYRLLEHNIVFFKRKKDKIKGWYICYWDLNDQIFPYLKTKMTDHKIVSLRERLGKEYTSIFYMCKSACVRMDFDKAVDFNFKCPECGEIMQEQDNKRTIEFIKERIKQLEATV
ncbi:hypothetical protein C4573_02730 [Candidatus Woesearchaeota archaeon]|nr:MAG: hypothetical protein C4573_02730 [Candidatus Woesearchaeota archaeon]